MAEAAPVATTHQARVVWLIDLPQVKRAQEAVKAERARQKIRAGSILTKLADPMKRVGRA